MSHICRAILAHALTPTLLLAGCADGGPPPANFAIEARTRPINPTTFEAFVNGTAFSPSGRVTITFTSVPNRSGGQQGSFQPTVQGDGTFTYAESFGCTTSDPRDVGTVLVSAKDLLSGHIAFKNIPGTAWLCAR